MSDWFKRHRVEWIAEMVEIYGFINREHIMKKFGVSEPQASVDLREARSQQLVEYNVTTKRYEKHPSFSFQLRT